jgi:hypothetical protein
MKRTLIAAFAALLTAALLPAQSPQTVGLGKSGDAVDNKDLNIRAYIELLRKDVRGAKQQVMAEVMQLDTEESTKFWPIYRDFEKDLTVIGDQIVSLVKNYTDHYLDMTDQVSDQLAGRLLDIERQRNDLKKKYYPKFKASLGAQTALRFLQVENQLEKLVDLQIASELPVVPARQ